MAAAAAAAATTYDDDDDNDDDGDSEDDDDDDDDEDGRPPAGATTTTTTATTSDGDKVHRGDRRGQPPAEVLPPRLARLVLLRHGRPAARRRQRLAHMTLCGQRGCHVYRVDPSLDGTLDGRFDGCRQRCARMAQLR